MKLPIKYKDILILVILLLISACFVFYRLGSKQLANWDEGLYANIVGEMVNSGDYLHLKLQEVTWLEKEPLPFWLEAISINTFGFNTFALRLPAALFSICIAPLVYIIIRKKLNSIWSFLGALAIFLSPAMWYHHMLRTADFDILSLSLSITALASYMYMRERKTWWPIALFLALGLMSRGVMGMVYIAIIIIAELSRPLAKLPRWTTKKIITIISASILPWLIWHLFLYASYGTTYIQIYWKEQFFTRITDPLQGHAGFVLFYADFLYEQIGILFILLSMFSTGYLIYLVAKKKQWFDIFLMIWLLATIIPPHVLTTKLEWYILPALPPLYIAICLSLKTILAKVKQKKINYILMTCIGCFSISYSYVLVARTFNTIQYTRQTPIQQFTKNLHNYIPQNQKIITYNIENWNLGRILPAYYWYIRYEKNLEPISIDTKNLSYYIARASEYPWWITDTTGFNNIQTFEQDISYTVESIYPPYMLIHIVPRQKIAE
ncbi:MAG TPA: hypothetical protein DCS29_04855 [Candidatus Magasanikbacteria bacterium]|nr:MAG: hypothetical protein A2479_03895 [Candidatus Magasanikbacteria bacterium RIFOXYC2_FULL_39_8]HAT04062.1 hypothetical protein [Candidatus Magasanikbacteria bacterium]